MGAAAMLHQCQLEHVRGFAKRLITIAVADDILGQNIAWHIAMNACGVWSQSITAIGNGRERLIVDFDTRGSIFREIAVLRDHRG